MAQVVKGTCGTGILGPGQTTWWSWKISYGDVWHFWVDNNTHALFSGDTSQVGVVQVRCHTDREGEWPVNRALIQIHNPGSKSAWYVLRVARII